MTDGIIKGTGNSRYMRGPANAATLYPDFESFRDAWAAGTLPFDLNGINPAGWETVGDKLGKATLLTDALCTALSLPTTATPTQAMDKLRQLVNTAQQGVNNGTKISVGYYVGTGNVGSYDKNVLTFSFQPKALLIAQKLFYPVGTVTSEETVQMITYHYTNLPAWYATSGSSQEGTLHSEWANNSIEWYLSFVQTPRNGAGQFNTSGRTYYYLAIG